MPLATHCLGKHHLYQPLPSGKPTVFELENHYAKKNGSIHELNHHFPVRFFYVYQAGYENRKRQVPFFPPEGTSRL